MPSVMPRSTHPVFNVAVFGTASQSCTFQWGVASLAIDGNTDTNWMRGSVTHTCSMFEAWWKVDLAFETEINKISLWNRMDAVSERLSNSDVVILDNNNNEIASKYIGDTTGVEKITFEFAEGTFGNAVMVKLRGSAYLSLAEVEVLSYSDSAQPSVSSHPSIFPTLSLHPSVSFFPSNYPIFAPSSFPTITFKKILNPYGSQADYFGNSISISGSIVVVGANMDDRQSFNGGSAYIFDTSGSFIAELRAPGLDYWGDHHLQFGCSVSVSGSTVVVGAFQDNTIATWSGAAYVFDIQGTFITKLVPHDGFEFQKFGYCVSVSGSTIAVGSRDDDNNFHSGSVYIYDISGIFVKKLVAPDGDYFDYFGDSVSISSSRIVIGAREEDAKGWDSGSAYIFDISGNLIKKLVAPDGAREDQFGYTVAVSDSTIVVGAHLDDDNGSNSGSAYIFDISGNFIAKIVAPDGAIDDNFGFGISTSGNRIVVGANLDDDKGSNSGAIYVFDTLGVFIKKIVPPDGAAHDHFGCSLSISDATVVVGARLDDDTGSDSGSVYIFDL